MSEDEDQKRRGSVWTVEPYARIRIIAAVMVILFALAVLIFRSFFG